MVISKDDTISPWYRLILLMSVGVGGFFFGLCCLFRRVFLFVIGDASSIDLMYDSWLFDISLSLKLLFFNMEYYCFKNVSVSSLIKNGS